MLFGSLLVLNEISTEAQLYLERQNIHQSFYVTHKTQPALLLKGWKFVLYNYYNSYTITMLNCAPYMWQLLLLL